MDRLRLVGVVSAFGVLLALPAACSGDSFSSANGGAGNGSGGSSSGSGGKNGQGGSVSHSGSTGEGGEGIEPGTGGRVGVGGDSEGGDPGMGGSVNVGGSGMTDAGPTCAEGSITFQMRPGPNVPPGYFCTENCLSWVAVYSHVENRWLALSNDCTINDCETCMLPVCPVEPCFSQMLSAQGVERTWDGTHYAANACFNNLGIDVTCQEPVCLPVGSYEVRMCAYVNEAGTPDMCQSSIGNQICKDLSFDYEGGELTLVAEIAP